MKCSLNKRPVESSMRNGIDSGIVKKQCTDRKLIWSMEVIIVYARVCKYIETVIWILHSLHLAKWNMFGCLAWPVLRVLLLIATALKVHVQNSICSLWYFYVRPILYQCFKCCTVVALLSAV